MQNHTTPTARLKSKIFKLEIIDNNGITRDYPVEAYELDAAIAALSKKINIPEDQISLSRYKYTIAELQDGIWKNPFIRAHETVDREESNRRKKISQANSEFKSFMNFVKEKEHLRSLEQGPFYLQEEKRNKLNKNLEVKLRYFYTTLGIRPSGLPLTITPKTMFENTAPKSFVSDTNDIILDELSTRIVPNTGYIVPVATTEGNTPKLLSQVFRFSSITEAYRYVRNRLIEMGIADTPYNGTLTYIEALDAWTANTTIDIGTKRASKEVINKYQSDMAKNPKYKYLSKHFKS